MNAAPPADGGAAIQNPAPAPAFDYFERVLPISPVICGRAMKPLSIGRYRRMRRQNVAFVSDKHITTDPKQLVGDLLKGVLICSMTCEEYDAFIEQPDMGEQVKKWAQRQGFLPPRYIDWPIVGGWINKFVGPEVTQMRAEREAVYLLEQIGLFRKYIESAQRIPNYTQKENRPSRHSLHWSNSIELHLRSEQNWTSQEIEEAPLSKALADYFGYAESNGLISILTDKDYEDADHNAKQMELLLKQVSEQVTKA